MKNNYFICLFLTISISFGQKVYNGDIGKFEFSMRLNEIRYIQAKPFNETLFLNYSVWPENSNRINSAANRICEPVQRNVKQISRVAFDVHSILNAKPNFIASYITEKNVIMLDEQLTIYNFVYDFEKKTVEFKNKIFSPKTMQASNATLFFNPSCNRLNVFSGSYSYSVSYFDNIFHTSDKNPTQSYPFHDAFATLGDFVFIAAGTTGVQLYSQTTKNPVLTLLKTFSNELALPSGYNVIDISVDTKNNYLYLLCNNTGIYLYVFNPNTTEIKRINEFYMNYNGGREFKVINNSVILLNGYINNGQLTNLYYLFEIHFYYSLQNKTLDYKLNRFFYEHFPIGKTYCGDEYCLIGWSEMNLMLFYGINQNIIKNFFILQSWINEPFILSGFIKINSPRVTHNSMVLTNKKHITLWELEENYAGLKCSLSKESHLQNNINFGSYYYNLTIFTESCDAKRRAQDYSILNYCKLKAFVEIELFDGFSRKQRKQITIALAVGLTLLGLILLAACFFCFRKYTKKIDSLQSQIKNFKGSNKKYEKIEEGENRNNDDEIGKI